MRKSPHNTMRLSTALVETLQLCIETGKYTLELGELKFDRRESDGVLFQEIRRKYDSVRHALLPMRLRFQRPGKAIFVKVGNVTALESRNANLINL